MSKKEPKQLAVTITDLAHVVHAGGDPVRITVLLDLTPEQRKAIATTPEASGASFVNITSITPVY